MRQKQGVFSLFLLSLSSRRAWIEIDGYEKATAMGKSSLSSRRAWIEMLQSDTATRYLRVALLAEGVDRNHTAK